MSEPDNSTSVEAEPNAPPAVAPESYLPSWVLQMRSKIAQSRTAHGLVERRISQLSQDVNELTLKIEQSRSVKLPAVALEVQPHNGLALCLIPSDALGVLLDCLDMNTVLAMSATSSAVCEAVGATSYWLTLLRQHYAFLLQMRGTSPKQLVVTYLTQLNRCLHFLGSMKAQRAVPRHRQVHPHRYSRNESTVSHPLPLHGADKDMMMSQADTLNSDFRSLAHECLQRMISLTTSTSVSTSTEGLDRSCRQLVAHDAVTVMLAMLSNEEGVLQEYACHVLANLLSWTTGRQDVAKELRAGNGHRRLAQLLTSPSACVQLSHANSHGSASNVQGMCNKQASRALVALFSMTIDGLKALHSLGSAEWLYFHKSGALKDRCLLTLTTQQGHYEGVGEDSIGMFTMNGHSERDMSSDGLLLILHKTYGSSNSRKRSGAHVSHVAYCNTDGSMWGVWETNTSSSGRQAHYNLETGGVFCVVPR